MTSTTLMGRARFNRCRSPRGPAGRRCGRYDDPIRLVSTGARPRGDLRSGVLRQKISPTASGFNRCRSPRGPAGGLRRSPRPLVLPGFQQVQVPEGTCGTCANSTDGMNRSRFNRCRSPRGPAGYHAHHTRSPLRRVSTGAGPRGDLRAHLLVAHPHVGRGVSTGAGPRGDLRVGGAANVFLGQAIVSTGAGPRGDLRAYSSAATPTSYRGFNRCRSPRGPAGRSKLAAQGGNRSTFQQVQVPEGTCGPRVG